ncbi:MAG: UTP--glucose-1-phosphate uridylyltransferase GalU [Gallionellaceae bacterium]|nr:UTP--glucose-1-phosphate uridylyltransferase GalU [Gallionellaceae bacterium]
MKKVTRAVFPVAGLGTRFLPATKANPKEMMPVVEKPLIQLAVEEAVDAGITDLIFITGRTKRSIEDHFDKAYEIETELAARGKHELLRMVQEIIPRHVNCIYIRQNVPLGLGHAVLCAQPVVGDNPFAVILADDLIDAEPGATRQMVEVYNRHHCSVLGVEDVPRAQTFHYGIVSSTPLEERLEQVSGLVEKPMPDLAPSTLAIVGRYVLTPRIFHHLAAIKPGAGGEIQLTDGLVALMNEEKMLAYRFDGVRYDCGSKFGYLKANIAYGLKYPQLREMLLEYMATLK